MAISIAQQVDLLYKQAFGVTKTDTANNKSPSNESIPSPLLIRGDTQWIQSDQIPVTAAAVANIVQAYQGASAVQMSADTTTVPVGGIYPTWLTNLTYWIPQEFGATYNIKIYIDNPGAANPVSTGTQIFAAGSGGTGEYYYNYQSGVLNFIGGTIPAGLTSGKVLYAVGYRYIGLVGVQNLASNTTIGNLSFVDTTISTTTANSNLILAPNGTGQVTTTASFTGSNFYGNNATFANLTVNLELAGNTANFTSFYVDDLIVSNTANLGNVANLTIVGGSNGQFLQTNGSGVLTWATVDSSKIANANTSVDIPVANGNILMSVNGNANIVVVTGTGANVDGYLTVTQSFDGNTANFSNLVTVANINVNAALNSNTGNFSGNITAANANLGNLVIANFVQTGEIINGNSNIVIGSSGNINFSATGTANVIVISNLGANVVGYVYANGDGTFGAVKSNSVTALSGNLQLYSEQTGNTYIELKPFGNGTVDVANFRISSLATPNAASDAATKQYVDDVAQGLNVHDSCYTATGNTLTNLTVGGTITYNNGTAGVGANLVLSGSYTKDFTTANTFDGNTTAVASSRILVKNEANAAHNGVYVVTSATVLTRAADYNTIPEVEAGDFIFVESGDTYNDTGWVQTSVVAIIGTDPIEFTQFSGAGTYQAGQGLTLTGTVFSVNVDNITTEISGGNVIVKANAAFTTPNIGAATGTSLDLTGNVLANNLNANEKVTGNIIEVTSNLTSNNITVNLALGGNTANFSGNVILHNLTVNVELAGNTANFSNTVTANNANIISVLTGNTANFSGNVVLPNLTVNLELAGNTANFSNTITANNANIISVLTGNTANFSGNVVLPNLTVNLELAGNTANFSNINVNALSVANTANLGNVGNITILGGSNGQFLQTNGNGVLNWGTVDTSIISNGTSNVSIPAANGNVNISSAGVSNILVITGTGANVTGGFGVSGNLVANNISANSNVDATNINANQIYANNTANILGDVLANANLTVTLNISGNTANFSGNVTSNNLTVNVELAGNTANFSNTITSNNANINSVLTGNTANFSGNVIVPNLTVNLELSGNTANFSGNVLANNLKANTVLDIGNTITTWNSVTTSSLTANQVIAEYPSANIVGIQFLVRGVDAGGSKYSVATVQAVTDGSNVDYAIFGGVNLGTSTGSLSVAIANSNVVLQVTPSTSNSTVWNTQYKLL